MGQEAYSGPRSATEEVVRFFRCALFDKVVFPQALTGDPEPTRAPHRSSRLWRPPVTSSSDRSPLKSGSRLPERCKAFKRERIRALAVILVLTCSSNGKSSRDAGVRKISSRSTSPMRPSFSSIS